VLHFGAAHFVSRIALIICVAAPAGTALAQHPAQRAMMLDWETRVDRGSTAEALQPLLDSAMTKEKTEGSWETGFLRRALVKRRLGQLTENRRYFDEALEDLWSVASEHRDWPWAWYGLASTKLAMARQRLVPYTDEHQPAGSSYSEEAGVALARALEADSTFVPARLALANATGPVESASPGAVLALAQLRREAGDLDSTITLLHEYLRIAGDSGVGYIELARVLFEAGRAEAGSDAYYAGVARARSDEAKGRLRDDLAWVMDSAELYAFDNKPARVLPAWIEAFWERRDVREVRRPGERLAEHYRRLAFAERHFSRVSERLRYTPGQRYRGNQTRLDDRAVIYIRHGEPDEQASFATPFSTAEQVAPQIVYREDGEPVPRPADGTPGVPPNLSWKYRRPDGSLILHFVSHLGSDYKLIESLLDVFSVDTVIRLQMSRGDGVLPAFDPARFARGLVQSRADLDPVYTRLANAPSVLGSTNLQKERAAGQRSLSVGTTTDSYVHGFRSSFEPIVQAYGVSRDGSGRILVVFGVEERDTSRASYPLSVRLLISTEDDRRVVQADTLVSLYGHSAADGKRYLAGYLEVPAPPGRHRLRAMTVDSVLQAGATSEAQEVALPPPEDPGLVMSDLILGVPDGPVWPGPDGPVALNPAGTFKSRTAAALYYSVGGLTVDSTYRTTIEIRADRPGGARRTASAFAMLAQAPRQAERRSVSFQGLKAGAYLLAVTVTGQGGSVTSLRLFRVE
jgi:GWxTD domain-containing protein